jgi:hypothetical protein
MDLSIPRHRARAARALLALLLAAVLATAGILAARSDHDAPAVAAAGGAGAAAAGAASGALATSTDDAAPLPERPTPPLDLARDDRYGAAAAAEYAFSLAHDDLLTGQHDEFDQLCPTTGSTWCSSESGRARDVEAGRATFTGCAGSTQVTGIQGTPEPHAFVVGLAVYQDDCTRTSGSETHLYPGGGSPDLVDVTLEHALDGWKIRDVRTMG